VFTVAAQRQDSLLSSPRGCETRISRFTNRSSGSFRLDFNSVSRPSARPRFSKRNFPSITSADF